MIANKTSRKKAHSIGFALFLIGIGLLFIFQSWWPAIALVIGLSIAVKKYLLHEFFDMIVALVIFIGIFVTVQFASSKWVLPVLFILGGSYIFFREFFGGSSLPESDREEDLNHEIEEETKPSDENTQK